ncbi:MAG: carboxypeptidase regulatory-like domain-containing protein [Bacteroidetes bacterium]|nr:carboxypeptidase regulatory-like domain-containing protein [Bacteroidota bacterium]
MRFILLAALSAIFSLTGRAQYVEKERDDTIRLFATTPFDSVAARSALAKGSCSIKGVAFTKPRTPYGFKAPLAPRIYADRITVLLFPVTPYLLDYLEVKKKENPKRLKFAYIDPVAWRYRYEAITNSVGEFTFPGLKPGKYYLEAILPWNSTGYHDQYTGSGYDSYGGTTNYYQRQYYNIGHYDKLYEFVDIGGDGEMVKIKLK